MAKAPPKKIIFFLFLFLPIFVFLFSISAVWRGVISDTIFIANEYTKFIPVDFLLVIFTLAAALLTELVRQSKLRVNLKLIRSSLFYTLGGVITVLIFHLLFIITGPQYRCGIRFSFAHLLIGMLGLLLIFISKLVSGKAHTLVFGIGIVISLLSLSSFVGSSLGHSMFSECI